MIWNPSILQKNGRPVLNQYIRDHLWQQVKVVSSTSLPLNVDIFAQRSWRGASPKTAHSIDHPAGHWRWFMAIHLSIHTAVSLCYNIRPFYPPAYTTKALMPLEQRPSWPPSSGAQSLDATATRVFGLGVAGCLGPWQVYKSVAKSSPEVDDKSSSKSSLTIRLL